MGKKMRVDKLLSNVGVASRAELKKYCKQGLISVNGKVINNPGVQVDSESDDIRFNGEKIVYREFVYIMLNKPKGVVSASRDSREKTVLDLLPPELRRKDLFPAGRLDRNTEGLLIITDDGEFSHKLLAPKSHVNKLYEAVVDRKLAENDVEKFRAGISEGGDDFLPADMKIIGENTALVEICEGKFHQIKRMFHAVGTEVLELKRLRIGGLLLDDKLSSGEARELSSEEINQALSREKIL